jgi:4-amino-4-deoxy-L-arabinose transferase-like glycosyltransferase/SAM-dependent methyltransferase
MNLESAPTPARPRSTLLTLLLLWVAFYASFTLFTPPLLDDADSVHTEVAREMLLRHDWVTLYADGIRYLEKAPVLYWSMAAGMKLFGVSAPAARLPLALAVLALALTLEAFARRAFRCPRAGLYAGLITLSSFGIFIFSRITIPDVIVCLWLTLCLYLFHLTEQPEPPHPQVSYISILRCGFGLSTPAQHRLLCYAFAATCALNILTKGLIGIVFPIAIVGIYLLLTRGPRGAIQRLRQLHPLTGTIVFLAIATPWHILAALANPTQGHPGNLAFTSGHWSVPLPTDGNVHGWFWFYFVNEQLLRYLNLRVPRDYDTVPLALFYGLIFIWLIPWSAFLIPALIRAVRNLRGTNLFLILWAAIPLLFFSLSTRQEYYVLPALPALILLIASWLATESSAESGAESGAGAPHLASEIWASAKGRPHSSNPATVLAWILLPLGTLAAATGLFFIAHAGTPSPNTDLATLLQQNPADYALSFGHFLDLNAQAMAMFRLPLTIAAISIFAATLANLLLRRRNRPHAANLALTAGAFGFLLAAHLGLQTFSPVLSSQRLARAIAPQLRPTDLIVLHGEFEAGSTLGFYLRRSDIHIWQGRSSNLWYGSFFSGATRIFETTESMQRRWANRQRIFLWQDPSDPDRPLTKLPGPVYLIAQSGGKQILSNQPNRQSPGTEMLPLENNTTRFTGRVAQYRAYRTRFPAEVVRWLRDTIGLTPDWRIADIGAGTGMLAELFLDIGCPVTAVEPNPDMRAACETLRDRHPSLEILNATAESTQLPSASTDLVAAGRAFHWFDPAPTAVEFRRILKPTGWVALVSSGRAQEASPQSREYEAILIQHGVDYSHVRDRRQHEHIAAFFTGGQHLTAEFRSEQSLTLDQLIGATESYSCSPLPGSPKYDGMQTALADLFARWSEDGVLKMPVVCHIHAGTLTTP